MRYVSYRGGQKRRSRRRLTRDGFYILVLRTHKVRKLLLAPRPGLEPGT